jgi:hypothetical protein
MVSAGCILYYFVEEQFKNVVLSHKENTFLSVLYIFVGLCVFGIIRINAARKNKEK